MGDQSVEGCGGWKGLCLPAIGRVRSVRTRSFVRHWEAWCEQNMFQAGSVSDDCPIVAYAACLQHRIASPTGVEDLTVSGLDGKIPTIFADPGSDGTNAAIH